MHCSHFAQGLSGLLKTSQQMKPALGQGSKTQSVESSSSNFFKPAEQSHWHGIPLWVASSDACASDRHHYEAQKEFLAWWAKRIGMEDPRFFPGCRNDPHIYLIKKVRHMLKNVRGGHRWGWQFGENVGLIIPCFVWSDGQSSGSQCMPLSTPRGHEQWWPCIVIPGPGDEWPFYCPALAWSGDNGSRAWGVHSSRVRARRFYQDIGASPFSGPGHTLGESSTVSESVADGEGTMHGRGVGLPSDSAGYSSSSDSAGSTDMSWTTVPLSSDSSSSDPAEDGRWEILD